MYCVRFVITGIKIEHQRYGAHLGRPGIELDMKQLLPVIVEKTE
jgi:hypothetical protein